MKTKIVRIALGTIFIVLILFFALPVFSGIRNVGNIFAACFFAALLFTDIFWHAICRFWTKKIGKVIIVSTLSLLSLCVIYAVVLSAMMISAASNYSPDASVVIILGCKVNPDGSPSLMLQNRLEAATAYLNANENCVCVVSGGQGANEPRTEAETMREYLIASGISADRILTEDKSSSTDENIAFSLAVLEENSLDASSVAIVTDAFHQLRASIIAGDCEVEASAVCAQTPWWLLPTYWIREWFGISEKLVFG